MQTKRKIQEKALELFGRKGFDNVTVDEIVKETETSKGAFYGHFESKDQIFIEKYKEIDNYYIDFISSLPKNLSNKEKILHFVENQLSYINNLGKDLMRVIYINNISKMHESRLVNQDRPLYQILEKFVEDGKHSGEFKTDISSQEISVLITRGVRGVVYDWCSYEEGFDLIKEGGKLIVFVLSGIKRGGYEFK